MTNIKTELKTEMWDISKLVDYARNPRKNDEVVPRMKAAILEFGFRIPIIAKSDGSVIDGHLRLKAARELGLKQVPVALADDLTEAQVKAFRILANKSANWAEWDEGLLQLELDELKDMDFDLELTGFDADELKAFEPVNVPQTDEDEVPEVQENEPPVTREGDVWLCGNHRVMCGDSTDAGIVALLMQGEKVDITLTSPPYGLGDCSKLRDHYVKGAPERKSLYDKHNDDSQSWAKLMVAFFDTAKQFSKAQFVNVQMLANNKSDLLAWWNNNIESFCDVLIWDKGHGAPQMQKNVLTNAFEFLFVFSNDGNSRTIPFGNFHGTIENILRIGKGTNEFADVHRAVYPVELPLFILNLAQNAKSVFDPFGGTGTTMIACEKTDRVARLMELSPHYCDVIVKRWQDYTGKEAVLESSGATFQEVANAR